MTPTSLLKIYLVYKVKPRRINFYHNTMSKSISFSNRYNSQITLYNQSYYDFGLSPNESCFCVKAIVDNVEYIVGHGYETNGLARRHAEIITNFFTIPTNVYKVTLSDNSILTEKVYDGKKHFSYRFRRNKQYLSSTDKI